MRDTVELLPKSREYFRKFKSANLHYYRQALKAFENPRKTGYGSYPNDVEMSRYLNNLLGNLDEGFEDISIPEVFSSPDQLVDAWKNLYKFVITNEPLIDATNGLIVPDKHSSEPFRMIVDIHNGIKGCLETILSMDEINKAQIINTQTNDEEMVDVETDHKIDVVILTALHDTEFEAFVRLLPSFRSIDSVDHTQYISGDIEGKKVIIATDDKMGMAAATGLTIKMLTLYKPRYLIMGGIAAGVKSDDRNFGDVLVARYTFNYESGKYQYKQKLKQTVFEPNPEPIELDGTFTSKINILKGDRKILSEIHNEFNPISTKKRPDKTFTVHFGPIASGSAVLADDRKVEEVRAHSRKLIGIDMETFGVYYGCQSFAEVHKAKAISIKSISDFADKRKTDGYRDFAAHTSARFIIELIKNLL